MLCLVGPCQYCCHMGRVLPHMLHCMCMQEAEALRAVMMVRRGAWESSRQEREVWAKGLQRGGHKCDGCEATELGRGGYGNSCKATESRRGPASDGRGGGQRGGRGRKAKARCSRDIRKCPKAGSSSDRAPTTSCNTTPFALPTSRSPRHPYHHTPRSAFSSGRASPSPLAPRWLGTTPGTKRSSLGSTT